MHEEGPPESTSPGDETAGEKRTFAGWYLKQSGTRSTVWQKRYIRMDFDRSQCHYYASEQDEKSRGYIDVSHVSEMRISTAAEDSNDIGMLMHDSIFELVTENRVWRFTAEQEESYFDFIRRHGCKPFRC